MEIFKYIIENIISIGLSSGIIIFFVNKISSQIKKKKKFHKLKNNLDDIITRLDNFIMNENDKNQIVKNGKIPFFDNSKLDNKMISLINNRKDYFNLSVYLNREDDMNDFLWYFDNLIDNQNELKIFLNFLLNLKIEYNDISFTDSNFIEKKFDIILIKNNILLKNIKKTSKHLTKSKLKSFIFNYWKQ
jgi:hypothetical protein